MTLVTKDRVLETCTSPGTGAVTLLGATSGYQSFSAAIGNGNTCYYTIADQSGSNWEVGVGTYSSSGNTLARTTVLASSSGGTIVNFSSGTQNVFVTYPADKVVTTDTLAYPPAIGGTTPNTGAFSTLTATGTTTLATTLSGLLKATTGVVSAASSGTDYAPPTSGTSILYGNGTGGFSNVTVGTGLTFAGGTLSNTAAGASITNDTTTASDLYPLFVTSTTGSLSAAYTSNANYLYKPSTGELTALEVVASNGFFVNTQTISVDYTLAATNNAMSAGPVSVASGITVTVSSGATWTVV